jgi:FMN phosphatase YigB (HAD superfamily)
MVETILFDLDDTLLVNPTATFIPAFMQSLGRFFSDRVPEERMTAALLAGSDAMQRNGGKGRTNQEAFSAAFSPLLGIEEATLAAALKKFYSQEYPKLRSLTGVNPLARPVLRWAFDEGYSVVIATDPMFPLTAIEQRLEWAGVPPGDFGYRLITSYENMHATKAETAYYQEILELLGTAASDCVMVGDDWQRDIEAAAGVGIPGFWIADGCGREPPTSRGRGLDLLEGRGTLEDFRSWLRGE